MPSSMTLHGLRMPLEKVCGRTPNLEEFSHMIPTLVLVLPVKHKHSAMSAAAEEFSPLFCLASKIWSTKSIHHIHPPLFQHGFVSPILTPIVAFSNVQIIIAQYERKFSTSFLGLFDTRQPLLAAA